MQSYSQPSVPSLYFETNYTNSHDNENSTPQLPSELLHLCLASYANWGDLAKIACVQKSWSNIVRETANQSTASQWELALALLNGNCGLKKSPERAVQLLKSLSHVSIDENTGKPIIAKEHKPKANNNDDLTIYCLSIKKIAECYLEGIGVKSNAAIAVAWMEAAYFIFNDSDAAYEMGTIYEKGRHEVEVDVVAAAEWFERGAIEGNVESMVELALCYELGAGIEQSDEQALDWYTTAANSGHATAKFAVGEIFEEARGVPQSDTEACIWYFEAAQSGCQDSKLALRRLYSIARIVVPGVTSILKE
jgi:TPR repeat protein